ncbi:hypothetical protein LEN26_001445 [Aphanomyces euteiches]|nr:hypothetical protein AeMF1_000430 [Aphanomyces euteiches]KAH9161372.1 hypothetical protein LEN26_001445 [Aphanomyces euteiches]KAH9196056.1 hypothetical protein AeNC1_001956 [Aphanomyces euteiches]
MATPEKKKQVSIASFFSPVSRCASTNPASVEPSAGLEAVKSTSPSPAKPNKTSSVLPPAKKTKNAASMKEAAASTTQHKEVIKKDHKVGSIGKENASVTESSKQPQPVDTATKSGNSEINFESMVVTSDAMENEIKKGISSHKRKASNLPTDVHDTRKDDKADEPLESNKNQNDPEKVVEESNDVIVIEDEDEESTKAGIVSDTTKRSKRERKPRNLAAENIGHEDVKQPARKKPKSESVVQKVPAVPTKPPLSSSQQQKLDTYNQKLTEIENLFVALVHNENKNEVLREVYGAYLDIELGLSSNVVSKCREDLNKAIKTPANPWVFPSSLKMYVAKSVQGRVDSLSAIAESVFTKCSSWLENPVDFFDVAKLEMEIKSVAERVSYGAKPKKAHMFQDTTPRAMWVWEVGTMESYFDDEAVKIIKRMRKQRKRTGQAIKTLEKIFSMIEEGSVDESKLSVEESKVSKLLLSMEQDIQKTTKKEEVEKQNAAEKELKIQQQIEKEEAKRLEQELKRKEKEEAQAEKKRQEQLAKEKEDQELLKRRQTWGSYLKKSETKSKEEEDNVRHTRNQELMDAIDKQLGLSSHSSQPQTHAILMFGSRINSPNPSGWSVQRKRHPTLGLKKLLQFQENFRPAYWGTYSKRSRVLRRGRRPFAMVSSLDYTVESDLEWDDDELGESLSDKDSEDENGDEDRLDYGDQWLAYEDEIDYIDERPAEEIDGASTGTKKKVVELHHRPSKIVKLVPRIVGPHYSVTKGVHDLNAYSIGILQQPNFVSPLLVQSVTTGELEVSKEVAKVEQPPKSQGIATWLKSTTT